LGHPYVLRQAISCFGWLLPEQVLEREPSWWREAMPTVLRNLPHFVGVELSRAPSLPLPREVQFVVCEEHLLPELEEAHRPTIIRTRLARPSAEEGEALKPSAGILGWIAD
jgi:hypothetical protein